MSGPARLRHWRGAPRRRAGVAAVEFALCLTLIFILLPLLVMFGRVFLYYHVLYNATRAAAQYVATAPPGDMLSLGGRAVVQANARRIVVDAAREVGLADGPVPANIFVNCDTRSCDGALTRPALIQVEWSVPVPVAVLGKFFLDFHGGEALTLEFDVTVAYAN